MKKKQKWLTGNITLTITGKPLHFELKAPATSVSPRRMLPVFQNITNTVVRFSTDQAIGSGNEISCKAGCGACCRQPVPISEAEAHAIAAYVETMDKDERKEIEDRFGSAMKKLDDSKWFERLDALPAKASEVRAEMAMEYFAEGIACPFLVNESCSIHKIRPLSCREYLVTSPAENCKSPTPESIEMVSLPAMPSYIFRKISKTDTNSDADNYVTLVSALEFVKKNSEPGVKKKGGKWLELFFKTLAESNPRSKKQD
jgi:Fe-S-cluster containining protein